MTGAVQNEPAPTESDIAAILVQFLTDVGNLMGRTRYYEVEAARHYGNLFVNIVGGTSGLGRAPREAMIRKMRGDSEVRNCGNSVSGRHDERA
jgi:hypothetical protein